MITNDLAILSKPDAPAMIQELFTHYGLSTRSVRLATSKGRTVQARLHISTDPLKLMDQMSSITWLSLMVATVLDAKTRYKGATRALMLRMIEMFFIQGHLTPKQVTVIGKRLKVNGVTHWGYNNTGLQG